MAAPTELFKLNMQNFIRRHRGFGASGNYAQYKTLHYTTLHYSYYQQN